PPRARRSACTTAPWSSRRCRHRSRRRPPSGLRSAHHAGRAVRLPATARTSPTRSWLEQHLEGPVLLLLEPLVGLWRLSERHVVGGEAIDAERVVVAGEERQDVVHPALDVGLAHTHVQLLVEHLQEG